MGVFNFSSISILLNSNIPIDSGPDCLGVSLKINPLCIPLSFSFSECICLLPILPIFHLAPPRPSHAIHLWLHSPWTTTHSHA
jgi:hypothetical protein